MRLNTDFEHYIESHTTPEDEVLQQIHRHTYLTTYNPRMISGPSQGKFLEFICNMLSPKRILEIGTFTGYSTVCMARGAMPHGHIDTIEVNDELEGHLRRTFTEAGLSDCITLHIGDAKALLPTLKPGYDFVYIDGDKRDYPAYFDLSLPLLRCGGYMLADNVLWGGKVYAPGAPDDAHTQAVMEFNRMVAEHPEVENTLIPSRDGLMLVRKIL